MFAQVVGRKRIHIFDPPQAPSRIALLQAEIERDVGGCRVHRIFQIRAIQRQRSAARGQSRRARE